MIRVVAIFLCLLATSPLIAGTRLLFSSGSVDPVVNLQDAVLSSRELLNPTKPMHFIVQFHKIPEPELLKELSANGIFLNYFPDHAYIVKATPVQASSLRAHPAVRWVGIFQPSFKFDPRLMALDFAKQRSTIVRIDLFPDANLKQTRIEIKKIGAKILKIFSKPAGRLRIKIPSGRLSELAQIEEVQWIEKEGKRDYRNSTTRWVIQSNASNNTSVWDHGIHGEGQIVGHIDGLISNSSCYLDQPGKIVATHNLSGGPIDGHGTNTAGAVVGDKAPYGTADNGDGNAFASKIAHRNLDDLDSDITLYSALQVHHSDGASVHSNSWGDDTTTAYTQDCRDADQFSSESEDDLVIFAVSNTGSIKTPENAKNVLAVGASQQAPNQGNHCQGGAGPTIDGRMKPELYAPGCGIITANTSSCGLSTVSGTSFAAPATAAAAMLVHQYFKDGYYPGGTANIVDAFTPTGSLIKAILLNSAVDMTGIGGYPGNLEGWGRVLLENALYFTGETRKLIVRDFRHASGFPTGSTASNVYNFSVNPGNALRVTLVWGDVESPVGAQGSLINDLDLEVTTPNGVFKGNVFSGGQSATGGIFDGANNVEQVSINNPTGGNLTIRVMASGIPNGPQGYSLVVSGNVSPNPAPGLPPPWLNSDIGAVGVAGSASHSAGVFTVNGSGTDIWNFNDSFHYLYQPFTGDGQIIARVASQQNTNSWAKAGVMIRNTLTANSTHASMFVTPLQGLSFQRRVTTAGTSASTVGGPGAAPYWVKISRSGNTFTGSRSTNGINWTVVGSVTITMGTNVYIGLAVTSHNNTVLSSVVFDYVSVGGTPPPPNNPPSVNITSPSGGSTFTAPASFNINANASDTDGTISQVEFFSGSTSLGVDPSSPYSVAYNNVPTGTYNLTAKATDNLGGFTISNPVTVNVQPAGGGGALPPPWIKQDVGAVGVTGSASHSSGVFTVNGAGSDIWGTVDSFNYVHHPLSGDGYITARVASQQNTNAWAKAGVMIRESLAAGSPQTSMLVTPTQGLIFERRLAASVTTTSVAGGAGAAPYWVKISRTGSTLTGSKSTDGINWTVVGSATIAMGTNIYIGLAVTSHDNTVVSAAVFDNVFVSGNPTGNYPPSVNITSPTNGATFTAPASFNINANASDTDGTITQVEFFSGSTSLGVDPSSPYSVPYNNVPVGNYNLTAKVTDNVGGYTISNTISVTIQPSGAALPPPWVNRDIGAVGIPGKAYYSSGAFTINGAGDDIWNRADAFHFTYKPLTGDGQIVARVAAQQNTNPWAKTGVMIRQTLNSDSPNAFMLITAANGLRLQRRTTPGATSSEVLGGTGTVPYWVKLVRSGNTFTGHKSIDGINWTLVGSVTITMPANVFIGLAHTSHNNAALGTAVLDNVKTIP